MTIVHFRRGAGSLIAVLLVGTLVIEHISPAKPGFTENTAEAAGNPAQSTDANRVKVDVIKPRIGGIDRTCIVPGSVHAFEYAELQAKISGYLQKQYVDIGDRVTEGQLLIEIDAPELHRDVDRGQAAVDRAVAQYGQMKARVVAAQADLNAAETGIPRAEAGVKRDQAALEFREKQFKRFRELANSKSIDERLVDEKEEQRLAAQSAVDASQANLEETKALVVSASAKVEQAKADLKDAEAEIEVTKANLAKAKVFASYTSITSPYDGIITTRGYHRGDFIRSADQNSEKPLLTVDRTDIVRLVVYIPDTDVPLTDVGDETVSEIDALPGRKFNGKVSRIAFSEDKKNKTMRTEIDLQNELGLLRNGMYGKTKLLLQAGNPKAFTISASALVGGTKEGKGNVFVVRDGVAHKTSVKIGADNGVQTEILEGLTANDMVVVGNNSAIVDGKPVDTHETTLAEPPKR